MPLFSVKSQIAATVHHLIYENDDAHCAQLNNSSDDVDGGAGNRFACSISVCQLMIYKIRSKIKSKVQMRLLLDVFLKRRVHEMVSTIFIMK